MPYIAIILISVVLATIFIQQAKYAWEIYDKGIRQGLYQSRFIVIFTTSMTISMIVIAIDALMQWLLH